jgi:hypothetical protein
MPARVVGHARVFIQCIGKPRSIVPWQLFKTHDHKHVYIAVPVIRFTGTQKYRHRRTGERFKKVREEGQAATLRNRRDPASPGAGSLFLAWHGLVLASRNENDGSRLTQEMGICGIADFKS